MEEELRCIRFAGTEWECESRAVHLWESLSKSCMNSDKLNKI